MIWTGPYNFVQETIYCRWTFGRFAHQSRIYLPSLCKITFNFLGTKFFLGVDDDAKIYVDGTLVDEHHTWTAPFVITVSPATSVIPIQVRNIGGPGMFVLATSSGVLSRSGNPVCRLGSQSGTVPGRCH